MTDQPTPRTRTPAQAWRHARGMTLSQLAEASGFSASAIQDFELGYRRGKPDQPISESQWKRYRLVCAALGAKLKPPF